MDRHEVLLLVLIGILLSLNGVVVMFGKLNSYCFLLVPKSGVVKKSFVVLVDEACNAVSKVNAHCMLNFASKIDCKNVCRKLDSIFWFFLAKI